MSECTCTDWWKECNWTDEMEGFNVPHSQLCKLQKLPSNPKQLEGDKKVKVQYIPPMAIIALGEALGEGGVKYGPFNWRDMPVEALTYVGGMLRHILAYVDGENIDPESGKHHLAGVMANAAIVIDAESCGSLIDNRPKKGAAGARIRELANVKI